MNVKTTELYAIAKTGGLQPRALERERGGLLVTVRGARVLGIYLDGVDENLLWVNPQVLGDAEMAQRTVGAGEWNVGGDRVWYAPEIELHFQNPQQPAHDNYAVPPDLDPGRYEVRDESPAGLALKCKGAARNLVSGGELRYKAKRTIRLCEAPVAADGLSYVGYELSSELRIKADKSEPGCYGLWQLMQLPAGGNVYIPTRGQPELVDYFQTGITEHVRVGDGHVVFPITGTHQHKLGLRADHVRGLMGYYRVVGDAATLIVRQAAVFPGAVYADYPAHDRARRDIALQFYNGSGSPSPFGEMEYHSPAAVADGFYHVRDVSRTWCFAGPTPDVRRVATALLGIAGIE